MKYEGFSLPEEKIDKIPQTKTEKRSQVTKENIATTTAARILSHVRIIELHM